MTDAPNQVDRSYLSAWLNDVYTDGQLKLGRRHRFVKLVSHPEMPFTPTQTLVLLGMASFMNEQGMAKPSLTRLAKACKLGRSTVFSELRLIELCGFLVRERTGGPGKGSTVYLGRAPTLDPRQYEDLEAMGSAVLEHFHMDAPEWFRSRTTSRRRVVQEPNHMVQEPIQKVQELNHSGSAPEPEVALEVDLEEPREESAASDEASPTTPSPNGDNPTPTPDEDYAWLDEWAARKDRRTA